jgi:hypothetical protein
MKLPFTRLLHVSYTSLTRLLYASYTPLTACLQKTCRGASWSCLLHASYTPLTRLLHATRYLRLVYKKPVGAPAGQLPSKLLQITPSKVAALHLKPVGTPAEADAVDKPSLLADFFEKAVAYYVLLRQYLYVCTSTSSKLSTLWCRWRLTYTATHACPRST